MSLHHFSSTNSKNTNWRHNSLAGNDHWNSKLSTHIWCEKNNHSAFLIFQNINKKNYISGIFCVFKSKLEINHAAIYIVLFLPDSNNCFFVCLVSYTHICFYYFIICVFIFTFLILFSPRHILQFTTFDSISLLVWAN